MYYWKLPPTPTIDLYQDMIKQTHLLIAGATGSGKTTLLTGLLDTMLHDPPDARQLIILDRKNTTLRPYTSAPHTLLTAHTPADMVKALKAVINEMDYRYSHPADYSDLYIIIDEMAELMTTTPKQATPPLQTLGQLAREARIHLIACTQTPHHKILPTVITCNFPARVALKTATAGQSRIIIDRAGAENLPDPQVEHRAQCYYRHGATTEKWNLPKPSSETTYLIDYWTKARKHFDGKRRTA